ncbi:unnamed protein product [Fraxinus pennsylvanica]|uniref:Pectinesterase inhibitor domain-containing protein n=1 Tax=Fraxinus pennsylvanica TaxID=56036 RepID=A0AAD1ZR43_9LAMI|nr:unnamed protein product [Fraxinus pennsylvanica]
MLTTSTLFSILFLISITSRVGSATIPSEPLTEKEKHKIVASDAITICLHEVNDISKYINAIPKLKSIQLTQNQKLLPCVQGLNFDLSEVQSALYSLKHLKEPYMLSYEHSLKHMTSHAISLWKTCSSSLKNEDKVVVSLLTRKLDDLSYLINNVVYHISEFLGDSETPGSH